MTELAAVPQLSSYSAVDTSSPPPQFTMFYKLNVALIALFAAKSVVAAPQLGDLPSIICLTGVLSSVGSGLLDALGITILDCSAGDTCTVPDAAPAVGIRRAPLRLSISWPRLV